MSRIRSTTATPDGPRHPLPKATRSRVRRVYGAIVATVAYVVAGGNPFWMLVVMVIIGVLFRLYAYRLIRQRGSERPPWWKWL